MPKKRQEIRPTFAHVVIVPDPPRMTTEKRTSYGAGKPEKKDVTVERLSDLGTVLAVGPGIHLKDRMLKAPCKPGDRVIFQRMAAYDIEELSTEAGEHFVIADPTIILAVLAR